MFPARRPAATPRPFRRPGLPRTSAPTAANRRTSPVPVGTGIQQSTPAARSCVALSRQQAWFSIWLYSEHAVKPPQGLGEVAPRGLTRRRHAVPTVFSDLVVLCVDLGNHQGRSAKQARRIDGPGFLPSTKSGASTAASSGSAAGCVRQRDGDSVAHRATVLATRTRCHFIGTELFASHVITTGHVRWFPCSGRHRESARQRELRVRYLGQTPTDVAVSPTTGLGRGTPGTPT